MGAEKYPKKSPQTGKVFTHKTQFVPTYTEEYCQKPLTARRLENPVPVLYPSRNTPHPLQGFMMWRLPNRLEPLMNHSLQDTAQLNPDQLVRNCKTLSTYQEDYVTSSKLAKRRLANLSTSIAEKPTAMLTPTTSSVTVQYFKPSTTRYGCNKDVVSAAQGIIPTAVCTELPSSADLYQTRYESEYTNTSGNKLLTKTVQFQLPKINATGLLGKE